MRNTITKNAWQDQCFYWQVLIWIRAISGFSAHCTATWLQSRRGGSGWSGRVLASLSSDACDFVGFMESRQCLSLAAASVIQARTAGFKITHFGLSMYSAA